MPSVLPAPEEYGALAPSPGSPVWRNFNDVRMLTTSGYATLLQVAHPTVGNGVHQYSSFLKDPWGRLLRTLDYVHGTIYGGPDLAGSIGERVRKMHRSIKGTKADGERYSAMEPDAFAWVHATLAAAIVQGREAFARPMTHAEKQAFLDEWLGVGRFVGVRPRDLPTAWPDFEAYFDETVRNTLTWTPAVPEVMGSLTSSKAIPGVPRSLWKVVSAPMSLQLRVATVGLIPDELRTRLDLPFSRSDRAVFKMLSVLGKASGPVMRGPLVNFGPHYVRWRRAALTRGDVAQGTASRREIAEKVAA